VQAEEIDSTEYSPHICCPNYVVQSHVEYLVHESKVGKQKLPIHGHVIDDTRFNTRNVHQNMENVLDRPANMTRKRNLEGNILQPFPKSMLIPFLLS
jgi:hypothetical protein